MNRALTVPLLAAALLLGACSSDGSDGAADGSSTTGAAGGSAGTGDVLAAVADDVLVPSYRTLADDLADLTTQVGTLCATPTTEQLTVVREAWKGTVDGWQATRPGAVGPASDLRLMSSIGFEARPKNIDKLVAGTDPLDRAAIANEGAAVRGLYAAEHLLFGDGSEQLASAGGARSCTYLTSVATLMGEAADEVAAAWEDGFRDEFVDGMGGEQQMSVAELVNEVSHRIGELDEKGLRDLAAADALDDLKAGRLDGAAAYAMGGRKALMAGVARLLGADDTGIVALVAARSPETATRLEEAARAASEALDALPNSVTEAFEQEDEVQAASDAIAELKVVLSTEAASQLGVTINFSDSDGDS